MLSRQRLIYQYMQKIKKMLRIMGFILLITLAVIGVGITGIAPVITNRRTKNSENLNQIELVEKKKTTQKSDSKGEIGE